METMLAEIQQEREATAELYARANEAHRRAEETRRRLQERAGAHPGRARGHHRARRGPRPSESVRQLRGQIDRIEAELRTSTITPQVSLAALTERLDEVVSGRAALLPPSPKRERSAQAGRQGRAGARARGGRQGRGRRGWASAARSSSATPGRDEVEVQVGALRMRARRADLRLVGGGQREQEREPVSRGRDELTRADAPAPSIEVDMRGWRADEVPPELERYLHDAYMANMPFVRIIHGKGTGALRQVVRDELATNPFVSELPHRAAARGRRWRHGGAAE